MVLHRRVHKSLSGLYPLSQKRLQKSSKYRLQPHLAYGTPFILASLQILHWHNGLGMLTQPPEPVILIFI